MRRPQPLLAFDPDFGEKDVAAVAEELLVVQLAVGFAGFGVSLCATVGDWLFTGSPLRKATACCSWKSSFEPISVGFCGSAGAGAAGLARGEEEVCSFCCAALFSRWRCRSASRTRMAVSVGSSTVMSGVMPSAWIERPLGV